MIQIISTLLLTTLLAAQTPDVANPPEIVFPPNEKIITEVLSVPSATVSRIQSPPIDKNMKPIVLGPSVTPPRVIYSAEPASAGDGRKGKPIGDVILRIVVGVDGKVHDVRVERSVSKDLDAKAIEAVKTWTFQPPQKMDGLWRSSSTWRLPFISINKVAAGFNEVANRSLVQIKACVHEATGHFPELEIGKRDCVPSVPFAVQLRDRMDAFVWRVMASSSRWKRTITRT